MKVLLVLSVLLAAASAQNLLGKLSELGFTKVLEYIDFADIRNDFTRGDLRTFFAPSNDAIDGMSDLIRIYLESERNIMRDFLRSHLVSGNVSSDALANEQVLTTQVRDYRMRINVYDNGVFTATGCPLSDKDQDADNGVIHTLTKPIFPPAYENLFKVSENAPDLLFLTQLLKDTTFKQILEQDGPYTFFAPSDDAFLNLDEDTINEIINNPIILINILSYHTVDGTLYSAGIESGPVRTIGGGTLNIQANEDGSVSVNNAKVFDADYPATNGVLHSIDQVLLPN